MTPVRTGEEVAAPLAAEKLLVVHYTLKNPNPEAITVSWGFLTFTAIGREGAESEPSDLILMEKTGEAVDAVLRPDQTLDACTILTVPAKGGIETLVIDGDDGSSLKIGIGSAVKPLPAAVADPADPSGFTALAEVAVPMETSCPLGNFGVLVEKAQYTAGPIIKTMPGKGARFLVVALAVSNGTPQVRRSTGARSPSRSSSRTVRKSPGMMSSCRRTGTSSSTRRWVRVSS